MKVNELMSRTIFSVRSDSNAMEAATEMLYHDIGCVLVREGDDTIGIVTERDFLKIAKNSEPFRIIVSEVMSAPLITISPEASLSDAGRMMLEKEIRRLAVKNGDGIVGLITSRDLLRGASLKIGNIGRWIALRLIHYTSIPFS